DGIRGFHVTGVQTCALPICARRVGAGGVRRQHRGRDARVPPPLRPAAMDEDSGRVVSRFIVRLQWGLLLLAAGWLVWRLGPVLRSEERRVGKGCKWRGSS